MLATPDAESVAVNAMAALPKCESEVAMSEVVVGGVLSIRIDAVFGSSLLPARSVDQNSTVVVPSAETDTSVEYVVTDWPPIRYCVVATPDPATPATASVATSVNVTSEDCHLFKSTSVPLDVPAIRVAGGTASPGTTSKI